MSMKREEQIEKARELLACGALSKEACDAIKADFPELAESEDERIRKHLIEIVKFYWGKTNAPNKAKELAYLEKLKEQKPAEWSEEDEEMIDYAYGLCYAAHETAHSAQDANKATKCMSWLKSLRPQPHWKPSEEQMNMLLAIVNDPNNAGAESCHLAMQSLYNDLKKLM